MSERKDKALGKWEKPINILDKMAEVFFVLFILNILMWFLGLVFGFSIHKLYLEIGIVTFILFVGFVLIVSILKTLISRQFWM